MDDDMPELEDCSEELNQIRKRMGVDANNGPKKINVEVKEINNDNNANIKINTVKEEPKKEKKNDDDFGCGLFKRGFLKRHKFTEDKGNKKEEPKPKQDKPVDLTHIKSAPETTVKSSTLNSFSNDLKQSQQETGANNSLLNSLNNNKQQWLNQELLMKIAKNPSLMKCFMDPRFNDVVQLLQKDPKECLKRYGSNPEFNNFIKEFSGIMGDHFKDLAKNPMSGNEHYNDKDVQEIIHDPKIEPILKRLQVEGKLDIAEIQKDPYVSTRFKVLIDKKILNIQKLD